MWVFTEFGDQQASKICVRTKYFLISCTWVTNLRGPGAPALTKMLKDRKNITVKAGQAYTQDSINELIIWKMNPFIVVPATGVKFNLAFLHT